MLKKYHWMRDFHDSRDHQIHKSAAFSLKSVNALPSSVDLRPECSPVEDQGQLGSCTGNALVGALEFLENDKHWDESLTHNVFVNLSRLFVYYNERFIEGDVKQDNGAQIRDGIVALHKYGVCSEAVWPYFVHKFAVKPSDVAYSEATNRKIQAYARVDQSSVDNIRQALASGYPIVFGFTVYSQFESDEVASTGVLNMPDTATEQNMGGHAVLAVGYDDLSQRVIVRNSWGSSWGQHGYFTMPYAYITSQDLSSDLWAITN